MKTVWKYEIPLSGARLTMPRGASVVRVAAQDGEICLWAIVFTEPDPDYGTETEARKFFVSGTGGPVPVAAKYVGSTDIGPFVWHVWEDGNAAV